MNDDLRLSFSSIKQFKACRRAYELRKVYGVYPIKTADALEQGSKYHEMLEELARTGELPLLDCKEAAMVHAYAKYLMPNMPKYEPEVEFERRCGKRNILRGRVDGKVIDADAIVEHKTTSLTTDEFEYDLQWDEQLLAYFWATDCETVFYTICRKPTIRKKQEETEEEYAQRCLEWYDEDTDSKIRMVKISRTSVSAGLQTYKRCLTKIFSEVRRAEKSDNFYRNTCNCRSFGRQCEYAPICLHYNPNEEYIDFEKRDVDEHYKHE